MIQGSESAVASGWIRGIKVEKKMEKLCCVIRYARSYTALREYWTSDGVQNVAIGGSDC